MSIDLDKAVAIFERGLIVAVLRQTEWNVEAAAYALNISRRRLVRRMKDYNISKSTAAPAETDSHTIAMEYAAEGARLHYEPIVKELEAKVEALTK